MWLGKPHQAEGALGAPDELEIRRVRRQDVVEKPSGEDPWGPDELGSREVADKM